MTYRNPAGKLLLTQVSRHRGGGGVNRSVVILEELDRRLFAQRDRARDLSAGGGRRAALSAT